MNIPEKKLLSFTRRRMLRIEVVRSPEEFFALAKEAGYVCGREAPENAASGSCAFA